MRCAWESLAMVWRDFRRSLCAAQPRRDLCCVLPRRKPRGVIAVYCVVMAAMQASDKLAAGAFLDLVTRKLKAQKQGCPLFSILPLMASGSKRTGWCWLEALQVRHPSSAIP